MKRYIRSSSESGEPTLRCRIAQVGEFDNGHVFFRYSKMTLNEAEEAARRASIDDPDHIYYVKLDNIMNPDTGIRYWNGQQYNWDEIKMTPDGPALI